MTNQKTSQPSSPASPVTDSQTPDPTSPENIAHAYALGYEMFTASLESMPTDAVQKRAVDILRLNHAAMGMVTEAGEFLDAIKKHIFYGKAIDEQNLREELGDMLFYISRACELLGVDIIDVMESNIRKLRARYPDKVFKAAHAIHRDTTHEMEQMDRT